MSVRTVVHLVRHGEVANPDRLLYGRLPGYPLSELGLRMAEVLADHFARHDIALVVSSSLTRAGQTAAPIAERHGLEVRIDDRVIEAANQFEGKPVRLSTFLRPGGLRRLYDITKPSWGEPYERVAERVAAAVADARDQGRGREIVIVSHQLPIWMMRAKAEGRRLWHDPRRRECSLASVTSFTYTDDELTSVAYSEPARSLLAGATTDVGA